MHKLDGIYRMLTVIYRKTHDFTKNKNSQAEVMLPKLSAECSVANNILASLIIFLAIYLINFFINNANFHFSFWYIVVIALLFGLFLIGRERFDRLLSSQLTYLEIVLNQSDK